MKVEIAERQSIAWFKLSEFIARGEKERAMSLLRLLMHSFDDRAYSKKLAAELLASFDDSQALEEYLQAAQLYKAQGDLLEAVSIFELLTFLQPEAPEYFEKVILLFKELGNVQKVLFYQKQLTNLFLQKGRVEKGVMLFESIEGSLDAVEKLSFFQTIVLQALEHRYAQQSVISSYLKKALDTLVRFAGQAELNSFLAGLETLNRVWHKDALVMLKEQQ